MSSISLDGRIKRKGTSHIGLSNNFNITEYIKKVLALSGSNTTYSSGLTLANDNVVLGGILDNANNTTELILDTVFGTQYSFYLGSSTLSGMYNGFTIHNISSFLNYITLGPTIGTSYPGTYQGINIKSYNDNGDSKTGYVNLNALGNNAGTNLTLYCDPLNEPNAIVIQNDNTGGPQVDASYANNKITFSNGIEGITMSMMGLTTFQSKGYLTSSSWAPAGSVIDNNTNFSKLPNLFTAVGNSGKVGIVDGNGALYKTPNGYVKVKNTETYYSTLDYQEFPNNLTADVVQNVTNFQNSVPNVFVFNLSSGVYRYSFQTECVELNETVTFTNNSANNVRIGCATNGVYDSNIYFRAGNVTNTPYILLVGETVTFKKVASNIYYLISKFT